MRIIGDRRSRDIHTGVAALSIAVAIGANAALYAIAGGLWFPELGVREPGRVVVVYRPVVMSTDGEVLDAQQGASAPALRRISAFASVSFELNTSGRFADWAPVVRLAEHAAPLRVSAVAHDYFETLGVPIHGRAFSAAEDAYGADPVAVVSDAFRRTHYPGTTDIIGRRIGTTRGAVTIVGVAAPGFRGARMGDAIDLWLPLGGVGPYSELAAWSDLEAIRPLTIFARLADGVSLHAAQDEARAATERGVTLRPLGEIAFPLRAEGDLAKQSTLLKLLGVAAALMVLLGSANLASAQLARAEARRQELAVRRCLGASSRQLLALVLGEGASVCVAGLVGGLFVRQLILWSLEAFPLPAGITVGSLDTTLDWEAAALAAILAVSATTLAGWSAVRTAANSALSGVLAVASLGDRGTLRTRQVLLASHVALTTTLLVASVGLAMTVHQAFTRDLGFARDQLLFIDVRPRLVQYMSDEDDAPRRWADYAHFLDRIRQLDGVMAAIHGAPLFEPGTPSHAWPVGDHANVISARRAAIGPGYLTAAGAHFIAGRDLAEADEAFSVRPEEVMMARVESIRGGRPFRLPDRRPHVVVDAVFANRMWPGQTAVGRSFVDTLGMPLEVIGVTEPLRHHTGGGIDGSVFEFETLAGDDGTRGLSLMVRTEGPAREWRPAVAAIVREMFPDAGLFRAETTADRIEQERAQERMGARAFTWFGLSALLLGAIGTHGLISYVIARARHELGVRAALGASHPALRIFVARRALTPVALGFVAGLAGAFWATGLLAAAIPGVATDPLPAFFATATLLGGVALAVSMAATRKVAAINPADLLRSNG